jgi:anti-anti-sigma factor
MKEMTVTKTDATLIVSLVSELSARNALELQQKLNAYQKQDIQKIIFDATDLLYLSSAGVRVIMFARKRFAANPEVEMLNCAKEIYDTLYLVGLTESVSFVEDERRQAKEPENEFQQKLAEMRQKDLEDFAAHNDVVAQQMKLGGSDEY